MYVHEMKKKVSNIMLTLLSSIHTYTKTIKFAHTHQKPLAIPPSDSNVITY
jgi:hypothetical protein